MKLPNKIALALNSWLTFEQMCGREPLFSEAYLAYPMGQFLGSEFGSRLVAEFPHPILAPLKTGRGDKPRIDFAVVRSDGRVEIAIETKWLSSSQTLQRDIIRDLVRLELMVSNQDSEAWLVVAGEASKFEALVGTEKFQGHPAHVGSDPILPHGTSRDGRLRLNKPAKFRYEMLKAALEPFHGVDLTDCIHTTRFGPYPSTAPGAKYVTYLWRVNVRRQLGRFRYETVYSA